MEQSREKIIDTNRREGLDIEDSANAFTRGFHKEDLRRTTISEFEVTTHESNLGVRVHELKFQIDGVQALKVNLLSVEKDLLRAYYRCQPGSEDLSKLTQIRMQKVALEDQELRLQREIYAAENRQDPNKAFDSFMEGFENLKLKKNPSKGLPIDGIFSQETSKRASLLPEAPNDRVERIDPSATKKKEFVISDESYRKSIGLDEERLKSRWVPTHSSQPIFDEEEVVERKPSLTRNLRPKMDSERPPETKTPCNPFLGEQSNRKSLFLADNQNLENAHYFNSRSPCDSLSPRNRLRQFKEAKNKRPLHSREQSSSTRRFLAGSPYKQLFSFSKKESTISPSYQQYEASNSLLNKKNRQASCVCTRVHLKSARSKRTFVVFPESCLYPLGEGCDKLARKGNRDDDCDSTDSIIRLGKGELIEQLKDGLSRHGKHKLQFNHALFNRPQHR